MFPKIIAYRKYLSLFEKSRVSESTALQAKTGKILQILDRNHVGEIANSAAKQDKESNQNEIT